MSPPAVVAAGILALALALVALMLAVWGWGDSPFAWYYG